MQLFMPRVEILELHHNCNGIKPAHKKVEAIQSIAEPKTCKQLHGFIGLVNYYWDMWIQWLHILAPLMKICSNNNPWKWTNIHRKAFHEAKEIIACNVMLSYLDFMKEFVIHMDASHTQLGAVISQDGMPITFCSRKLNNMLVRHWTSQYRQR